MKAYFAYLVVIFLMLGGIGCGQRPAEKKEYLHDKTSGFLLDTVITKKIRLTVENEWATVYYHLKVKDWKKPVEWTFDVIKEKDTLYTVISDDAEIDTFFYDLSYTAGLGDDYLSAKKYWYLSRIYEYYCDTLPVKSDKRRSEWEKAFFAVRSFKLKDTSISITLTDSLWEYYRGKPVIWYSFIAGRPVDADPGAWAYFPKVNKMVCIYGY